ncbi:PAAR-like domain-containing protein [Neptunomonas sp.]|uniref:PAAR-like domain-containing protein n=1 Tax=Neptunomonas sp. TaxID=1971898 RepID=UPI0025EB5738|nr:PAAR-like domain-containing protein [Neptunomonas sp.]
MSKATVFANDMSYAAKAYDGKSSLQLVDICHSPGKGIPKPYKNIAYASQLTNASVSVFISHLPVAQKDKSYFANSTGNENATDKVGMGIVTHVITGGAHFVNWSPDVFVEGYNACRHLDSMTHNHSNPPNTGYWIYKDYWLKKHPCEKHEKKVDKKCQVEKDRKRYNKKRKGGKTDKASNWKEAHCDGLMFKPSKENIGNLKEDLQANLADIEALLGSGPEAARSILQPVIEEAVEKFILKTTAKTVVKAAAGAWIPVAGWVWAGANAAMLGYDASQFVNSMQDLSQDFEKLLEDYKKLATGQGKEWWDKLKSGDIDEKDLMDLVTLWANMNPCIRAKRCNLQPYEDTSSTKSKNLKESKGCCPGQTPHHVIPDTWMKKSSCVRYTKGAGLSICTEGRSHNQGGSHQGMHDNLDKLLKKDKLMDIDSVPRKVLQPDISMDKATDMAAASIKNTFPASGCDKKCLVAQIEDYYDKLCGSVDKVPLSDHKTRAVYKPDGPNRL